MYSWNYVVKATNAKLDLTEEQVAQRNFASRYPIYANEAITAISSSIKPKRTYAKFAVSFSDVFKPLKMPDDFIAFGDDVNYAPTKCGPRELHDTDFKYNGYNEVVFFQEGIYYISYNARWHVNDEHYLFEEFDPNDDIVLAIPDDIVDCLPTYIASQCMLIDDPAKSNIYRNEYELMLARIDDTNFKDTKTILVEGDW